MISASAGDLLEEAWRLAWSSPRRPRSALKLIRHVLEIEPASSRAYILVGDILSAYRNPRYAEAERAYREAVRLAPDSAEPHGKLAALLLVSNRLEEAIDAYREAIRRDSEDGRWCVGLGASLLALGRHRDARPLLARALSLKPVSESSIRLWLADAYALGGEHGKALEQWRIIVRNGPAWPEGHGCVTHARRKLRELGDRRSPAAGPPPTA